MIQQTHLTLPVFARGYHLITKSIQDALPALPDIGLLHIFLQHTSAALTINENADPSVRVDFETFMNRLAPEDHPETTHTLEGSDDMPAHIKASLLGPSLTIPITDGRLQLGTWQGIYLCEFRNRATRRNLIITIYS